MIATPHVKTCDLMAKYEMPRYSMLYAALGNDARAAAATSGS